MTNFNSQDIRECTVLFGGCKKGNKVDKNTGIRTAEEYFQVQIMEVDFDANMVNSKMFYVDEALFEEISFLELQLLKPCKIYIKSSATSNYVKLVGVQKVEIKKTENTQVK